MTKDMSILTLKKHMTVQQLQIANSCSETAAHCLGFNDNSQTRGNKKIKRSQHEHKYRQADRGSGGRRGRLNGRMLLGGKGWWMLNQWDLTKNKKLWIWILPALTNLLHGYQAIESG